MFHPSAHPEGFSHPAVLTEVIPSLSLTPDYPELRRYLGYTGATVPGPKLALEIERLVRKAWAELEPRGVYAVLPVQARSARSLTVRNRIITGGVADFIGDVERVGVFVVTVGGAISRASDQACRAGDALSGLVLDALGSWAAEAGTDELMRCLGSKLSPEEALSLRYSPGYCGLRIEEQRALFELVDATSIGVSLTPSSLMQPAKSVSGIVGIGPREHQTLPRSPCDSCSHIGCHMRRGSADCP